MSEDLEKLSEELFRKFARFEYALKAAGFFDKNRIDAKADWDRYAISIASQFDQLEIPEFRSAVDYVLQYPPKKQVIVNNRLEWENSSPNIAIQSVLVLVFVRRVRNNLFHGGKFNGHWFDPQRSHKLIQCSLQILEACLIVSDEVREAFG